MGSVLGEEWWVFGVGDEVRLRDGARGWEAWLRSAQGGCAKVRLDAVYMYATSGISIRLLVF